MCLLQAATIRLPGCQRQSPFCFGQPWFTEEFPDWASSNQKEFTPILSQKLQTSKNHVSYKTINIFWLFNFTDMFCYSGTSAQAVLWPSLIAQLGNQKKMKIETAWVIFVKSCCMHAAVNSLPPVHIDLDFWSPHWSVLIQICSLTKTPIVFVCIWCSSLFTLYHTRCANI